MNLTPRLGARSAILVSAIVFLNLAATFPGRGAELISVGDAWKYFKGMTPPPANWMAPEFNDSRWMSGLTPMGYGDLEYRAELSDMRGLYNAFFARRPFRLDDADSVSALRLHLVYDDGFIAYLNGMEVARSHNLGSRGDRIPYNALTRGSRDEEAGEETIEIPIRPGLLRQGVNVLAIEIHNVDPNSSDAALIPRLVALDNLPPQARLAFRTELGKPAPVKAVFDGSASIDPDGNLAGYRWTLGDSQEIVSRDPRFEHVFLSNGVYRVTLTVQDAKGLSSETSYRVPIGPSRNLYVAHPQGPDGIRNTPDDVGSSDAHPGDAARPFASLAKACQAAVPGDTVWVRSGVYRETLRPENSGLPGFPITFRSVPGEHPLIREAPGIGNLTRDEAEADQGGRRYGIYLYGRSDLVIEGFSVDRVHGWARIVHSQNVTLQSNRFSQALAPGTTGGVKFVHSDDNRVRHNQLEDGNDNLMLIHSDRNLVEGNRFLKARHALWAIKAGNFNVLRSNYFHNASQKIGEIYDAERDKPVRYDATKRNLVERNIFAKTPSSGNRSPYAGIQHAGQQCVIRRNVFYDTVGPALDLTLYSREAQHNYGNRVYHNVFYASEFAGISIGGGEGAFHDNVIRNNILAESVFVANDQRWRWYTQTLHGKPVQLLTARIAGFLSEGNNFYSQVKGSFYFITRGSRHSHGARSSIGDVKRWQRDAPRVFRRNLQQAPQFVDPDNHDFQLLPGSPMIDAGVFLAQTREAGSGRQLALNDVLSFYDGFGIQGEKGDLIQLEGGDATARVVKIDYLNKTLELDRPLSWSAGQGVSLAYEGKAPDIGAFEFEAGR